MNEFNYNLLADEMASHRVQSEVQQSEQYRHARLWKNARDLYARTYARGKVNRILALVTRRRRSLYTLNGIGHGAFPQHYQGLQTVPIALIQGSEGRRRDFDGDFRPLNLAGQRRWMGVAVAMLEGQFMPAISLIRVGDVYFVRDGHHRVSVARAWGQAFIDAEVTVWEAPHPLPWEKPVPASQPRETIQVADASPVAG